MTWNGVGPSGWISSFNQGGGIGSVDYEPPRGDVSGVIDNLLVIRLYGNPVAPGLPSSGNVLAWNGNSWISTDISVATSGLHSLLSPTHPDTTPASPVAGDLIAGSGVAASWARFPIGAAGQKLRVSESGELIWAYDPLSIITVGATVNLGNGAHRVVINKTVGSNTLVNLPSAPYFGQEVLVKDGRGDANVNPISVQASGSTIDTFSQIRLTTRFQSLNFMWNGTAWNII